MKSILAAIRSAGASFGVHLCAAGCGRPLGPMQGRWAILPNGIVPTCLSPHCIEKIPTK